MTDLRLYCNYLSQLFTWFLMAKYYHVSPHSYAVGSTILPGWHGKYYRQYVKDGNVVPQSPQEAYHLTWEATLETARLLAAPNSPSRLDCIFACTTLAAAEAFRARYRQGATIYRIKVARSTPTFIGDLDGISNTKSGDTFINIWAGTSVKYWTQKPQNSTEVLIGGTAEVVEILQGNQ